MMDAYSEIACSSIKRNTPASKQEVMKMARYQTVRLSLIKTLAALILLGHPLCVTAEEKHPAATDKPVSAGDDKRPGLVGASYGEPNFARPKGGHVLNTMAPEFDSETGFGTGWSAKWEGELIAPATGKVGFGISTSHHVKLEIAGKPVVEAADGVGSGSLEMIQGQAYPITIFYKHIGGKGRFRVEWSWPGHEPELIPISRVSHTAAQEDYWNWRPEPDPTSIDRSQFVTAQGKQVFVYKELGRFAAWPANSGAWSWGNEILVGFELGYYQSDSGGGHAFDGSKPFIASLARSLDGGETWTTENPDQYVDDKVAEKPLSEPIRFDHPDFALRCQNDNFFFSYDRGKTWQGRFKFPKFIDGKLTSRTDYRVDGPQACTVFLSGEDKSVQVDEYSDRVFCVRTTDGGLTWKFLGWVTGEPLTVRSVMPATVRISPAHLVSVMRRRIDKGLGGERPPISENWIDAYESKDDGKTWSFLSKVAETDRGKRNGNPPAMVRLRDGRLVVAHGYRSYPYGIRARISKDNGTTWGDIIHLRDDAVTWDMGYCRMVERPDGKIVTIYYYNTAENIAQHIAATIWDPNAPNQPK
jgi:hypothetical protein